MALPLTAVVRDNRAVQVVCQNCEAPSERDGLDALPGGFGFVCAECGHESVLAPVAAVPDPAPTPTVEPTASAAIEAPAEPVVPPTPAPLGLDAHGQIVCPKCQHRQSDPEACHRCGLLFANVEAGRAHFDTDLLANVAAADLIRARWTSLAADLDDAAGHLAFVELCALHDALEFAGDRYRRLADDARVAPYQKKVVQLALARVPLESRAMTQNDTRTRRLIVLTIAALILLGFAYGYYLLSQHQTHWQGNG